MRPAFAYSLLSLVAAGAIVAAVVTSSVIFMVVGAMAAALLVSSLAAGRRPLMRQLGAMRNREVEVRIWGAAPPLEVGSVMVLSAVYALGAGFHLFFSVDGGGSFHLKVAQPRDVSLTADSVVIGSARYVQWQGRKQRVDPGVVALSVRRIR